jgi:DNA-binding SARP family transcriptional activator
VCQDILSRDSSWEAAYRLLMQVHGSQGNQARVHSVYQQCVAALRDQLGVEPSSETEALYRRLS